MIDPAACMRQAIELAEQARGRTAPNPMVGALILRDGQVVGEGFHHAAGQPHAEVEALSGVDQARGATLVVTLEPCCHHGRTPPCTDAVIGAGISRVIVGMLDPDPRVAGKGVAQLRAAGLQVIDGVEEEACRRLNEAYLCAKEQGRPWITLKAAATLDGRIADHQGHSKWITGEAARQDGHQLRDTHDAILVGKGTVIADDPSLTCRLPEGRDPQVVVLGSDLPADAKVFEGQPWLFDGDLSPMLQTLVSRGVHSVLVEGGGKVHRSFLDAGLVDRVVLYLAPRLLVDGPGWVRGEGFALADAPGFVVDEVGLVGSDVRLVLSLQG